MWPVLTILLLSFCFNQVSMFDMDLILPSFVLNQNVYACSTRDDCCLKAMATLRSMISTATNYAGTTIFGTAIYPKCSRSFNYDPVSGYCTKTVPFEASISHPAFDSLQACLNPATSPGSAGDIWQRQKECLRPFWMVHEECITRTMNNCLRQNGRCDSAFFSDWTNGTIVEKQYS